MLERLGEVAEQKWHPLSSVAAPVLSWLANTGGRWVYVLDSE